MLVIKPANAGSLESSDALVTVEPEVGSVAILIEGATAARFSKQIRGVVEETLGKLGISSCRVRIQDKGALDCTIRARLCAAALRAAGREGEPDWESLA